MPSATSSIATHVSCLICEGSNSSNAVLCRECSAPMALTRDASTDRPPSIVSIIGDSNVGKTVYLGFLLDMLSQRAKNFEAIPRGAYSVDLQQTVISHMAYRVFPPKTSIEQDTWNWAYYQVCRRARAEKWVDLIMPDLAGEAIAAEVDSPTTFRVIHNLVDRSAGLMLLLDAALAAGGSSQPDFFGMKMLSYLDAIYASKRGKKIKKPIAFVLTKADYVPTVFEDPKAFVKSNLSRTWNLCESRFGHVEFFASSVVGSIGYAASEADQFVTPVPLHTALRGILEPFEWMLDQI